MKRSLVSFWMLFAALLVITAQEKSGLPDNAPADIPIRVEYFFDTDPGFGKATGVASETAEQMSFNAPIADLNDGLHTLYVRAKNSKGWSQTQNRTFVKTPAPAGIKAAECYIDIDPGAGKGMEVPFAETDMNFTVDLTGMEPGEHWLYIRISNQLDQWEEIGSHTFTLINPVGTENAGADNLAVYPNPVSDFLFIRNENHTIQSVEITDMKGQQVCKQDTQGINMIAIPASHYATGTYMLTMRTLSQKNHTFKIIKK